MLRKIMCKLRLNQLLPYALIFIAFFLLVAPTAELFETWDSGGLDGEMIYTSILIVLTGLLLIRGVLSRPSLHALYAILLILCERISHASLGFSPAPINRSPAILRI
jgi:hypothetical protein